MAKYNTGNPVGSADPRDRHDNSQAFDQAINSDQTEFQDRLGKRRLTVQGMVDAATTGNPAVGAAQEALASADRAEGEADRSESKAEMAVSEANRANFEADRAEAARDAAIASSQGIYEDAASGIAAVADGDYFSVPTTNDNDSLILYRRNGTGADEINRYPSSRVAYRKNYPFANDYVAPTSLTIDQVSRFIRDIKVFGPEDLARDYSVQRIRKNDGGVWEINLASEENIGGVPSSFTILSRFRVTSDPSDGEDVTYHDLAELSGSGVSARVAVDWSAIPDGNYVNLWAGNGYAYSRDIFSNKPDPYGIIFEDVLTSRLSQYPLAGDPSVVDENLIKALKDVVVYSYDGSGTLFFNVINKDDTQSSGQLIRLAEIKDGVTTVLCQFSSTSAFAFAPGVQYIESTQDLSGDGVRFGIWIDWDQLPNGNYSFSLEQSRLNDLVYRNSRTLKQPLEVADSDRTDAMVGARSSAENQQIIAGLQKITGDYNHIISYGQSLSIGNVPVPINTTPDKNSKMIGDDPRFVSAADKATLYDLVTGTDREPPGIQATRAFKDLMDGWLHGVADKQFVFTATGQGGTSIELLSKGAPTSYYENEFLASLSAMKAIADGEGKTVRCPLIVWIQGEANMTENANQNFTQDGPATSDKTEYKQWLSDLVDDMVADVKSVYGQDSDPLILMYVTKNSAGGIDAGVQAAQVEYCQENYNAFVFSPTYFLLTGDDGTHPTANGYRWLGEYIGKSVYKALAHEKKPHWLTPREISIGRDPHGDNFVDVHFNVPVPPLRKNTETYPVVQRDARDTLGFGVYDNGVRAAFEKVELFDNFVRIWIQSKFRFTTDNITVTYADSTVGLNASGAGNLCDSDDFPAKGVFVSGDARDTRTPNYLDGTPITDRPYPLYNWCVPFSYTLNGVGRLIIE